MSTSARSFAPTPSSVPAARRFLRDTLAQWQLPSVAEAAELLVAEVCTNAVLHARTEFTVEVARGDFGAGEVVRVRVIDASSAMPRQRNYGSDSTTGRGIRLVDTLASSWGVDRIAGGRGSGPGKVVFFDVLVAGDADRSYDAWDADIDEVVLLDRFRDPDEAHDRPTAQVLDDDASSMRTAA